MKTSLCSFLSVVFIAGLFSFCPTLRAQISESHIFTSLGKAVPDDSASGMHDVQTFTSSVARLAALRVNLRVVGEFNGDLYAYLRHTDGTTTNFCILLNRVGKCATNRFGYSNGGLDISFDDVAGQGDIHDYQAITNPASGIPLSGIWAPDARNVDPDVVLTTSSRSSFLTNFLGASGSGEWTLFLADLSSGGTNMLAQWGLEFTGQTAPTLSWTKPLDITYGTALGAAQLNASAVFNSTNVSGTFSYSPSLGTMLPAGAGQVLSVTFTPSDTSSFIALTTNVTINVNPAVLAITANPASRTYGTANPVFGYTPTGFVNGDTAAVLSGSPALTTSATSASPVGAYAITTVPGTLTAANYSFNCVNGTLTVNPASLTISANSTSRTYGAANPVFTYTASGFVSGDTGAVLSGSPSLTTTATSSSPVGTYPIMAAAGTLSATNYAFQFANGTLAINAAPLTITANSASRTYGASNPSFSYTPTGFLNGDTSSILTGSPILTTTATPASPVGPYAISAASGTLAAPNYALYCANGTLTVTKAVLNFAANNTNRVFGAPNPVFTASCTGFQNGENLATSGVTGTPSLTTTATTTSPVPGPYTITAGIGTLAAGNYNFSFADGQLTVNKASTTGSLVSSGNPALPGTAVAFSFTTTAQSPGSGIPTGQVRFRIDETNSTLAVLNSGSAYLTNSGLAHGIHAVASEYAGDGNFLGATNLLTPAQIINSPPTPGAVTLLRDGTNGTKILVSAIVGNATDADGDLLTLASFSASSGQGGSVTQNGAWLFYEPPVGSTNADTFSYSISDGYVTVAGLVAVSIRVETNASPNLTISSLGGGFYLVKGDGIPGRTYRIQWADAASSTNWQTLASALANSTGQFRFTDTNGAPQRFYRSASP